MIRFENVTKQYRGTQKPALDRVSLTINRGEFVFIVGASGSGKSSCLQLMMREEQPTSGTVHVLGHELGNLSTRKVPYFRRNLGVVFQDFRLLTGKTVYDNVAFSLQVIGKSRGFIQEAVPDTLEMVGLSGKAKRYPHELSGGEQQRVAIARAIVNKPAILLADEPTGNLDPATSLGIMQLLRSINASGTTVVMATHEAVFVDIMQQRVLELSQGIVVRDEKRGGYGETAAISLAEIPEAQRTALRTTEDAVKAVLAPDTAIRPLPGQANHDAAGEAAPRTEPAVAEPRASSPRAKNAGPVIAPRAAAGSSPQTVAEPEETPSEVSDETVSAREAKPGTKPGAAKKLPAFLDPHLRPDPVELSETGNLAQSLGLGRGAGNDDEQTDVGPVR